ncbi:MAG TPA: DUF262 domain-containing protein [Thermoleophilaceae bacterium]|nr:DUF262 domain-containing protein [Thermoleophilaceae bacterium]
MDREATTLTIQELQHLFAGIEFPEYQREPSVWNLDQKRRLMDSILRRFDIAPIYLYEREDGGWECIDGRQRLNAVMSFLGINPSDEDNGFSLRIQNEVADDGAEELDKLNGLTFDQLDDQDAILDYPIITVRLSGTRQPSEFNLQFLRLNLGTLINAGEKLHAMVGVMRDRLFEDGGLGQHPFLTGVGIPTRRYARELLAAQLMLHASSRQTNGHFARARHFDLQRYLKMYDDREDPRLSEVRDTLDALHKNAPDLSKRLGNRAIAVSVILAAWELGIRTDPRLAQRFGEFVGVFLDRLAYQVKRMKEFNPDPHYEYLVEFQRHLTQAAVERPAVDYRHRTLTEQFELWSQTGELGRDEQDGHS